VFLKKKSLRDRELQTRELELAAYKMKVFEEIIAEFL
jgi:hypothetical protein